MDSVRLPRIWFLAAALVALTMSPGVAAADSEADIEAGLIELGGCTPVIGVSPNPLDFGGVGVGSTSTLSFTISNDSSSPSPCDLTITLVDFGVQSAFDWGSGSAPIVPFSLDVGQTFDVDIEFAPSAPDVFNGEITIDSNDPDFPSVTLALTGTGTQPNEEPTCNAGGPYSGNVGEDILFDGSLSTDPDGTIDLYEWDFGDGTTGTGQTATHSYASAGDFTVTLTVTDNLGASSSCDVTASITEPGGPSLTLTAPAGGEDFDIGQLTNITWTSDGGVTAVDISLIVDGGAPIVFALDEDDDGLFEWTVLPNPTDNAVIRIEDTGSSASDDSAPFAISGLELTSPNGGEAFQVGGSANITWDRFGSNISSVLIELSRDGGTTVETIDSGANNNGVFQWTVTGPTTDQALIFISDASNPNAEDASDDVFSITEDAPPTCDPGGPYQGNVGEALTFDGSGSTGGSGTIVSWDWEFGDGNSDSGETVQHTYTAAGDYTVTLTVTDDLALVSTCNAFPAIIDDTGTAPVCDAGGPYTGDVDVEVTFDGSGSSDSDGTIVSWDWLFGDGSGGSGETTTHTYTSGDLFTVTLTVTDDDDLSSSCTTTADITGPQGPVCDAGGPYQAEPDEVITFDGSGSSDPDGTIVSWDWEFGDGATDSGETVTHSYPDIGLYTVTLTVEDDDGTLGVCSTTADIIGNFPPTCDHGGPYDGVVNEPVVFDGSGSTDDDGIIVLYEWEFSTGSSGEGVIVEHTFDELGVFFVTLTVTDDGGASSSCQTDITIGVPEGTVRVCVPPRSFGLPGQDVVIPVYLKDDVTGAGVLSAEISLIYDRNLLDFRHVSLTGTIGEGGIWEANVVHLGPRRSELFVSIAWATPLEDCETFANLIFEGQIDGITEAPLELDVLFNEGLPPVFATDGDYFLGVLGDVNGSGNVSAIDASLVLQETVGQIELPDPDYPFFTIPIADVSGNLAISALDASLIMRYVLGIIDIFPAQDVLFCEDLVRPAPPMLRQSSRSAALSWEEGRFPGTVDVTLSIDEFDGVYGSEFDIAFDPTVLRPMHVTPLTERNDVIQVSRIEDGMIKLSVAAANPEPGSLDLAKVRFQRLVDGGTQVDFDRALINEGDFAVRTSGITLPAGRVAAALDDTVRVAVPPRVFGARGGDSHIPIFLEDDVTGMEIFSAEIVIGYRPSVINAYGVDLTDTIGDGGITEFNVVEVGPNRHEAHISIAWIDPLEGCEEFARMLVSVDETSDQSALDLHVTFNEGVPAAKTSDGVFIIGLLGDVNASGQVTALDASLVLQSVVGIIEIPDPDYPDLTVEIADVSGNGEIRAFDAALILQFVLGLIDVFPAEDLLACDGGAPAPAVVQALIRQLEILELERGEDYIDVELVLDQLDGIMGAEVVLDMPGAGQVTVESAIGGNALFESRREGDRLVLAVALPRDADGAQTLARLRIHADDIHDLPVDILAASLNEGSVEVTTKGLGAAGAPVRHYQLLQNVPNPFNPSTELRFDTPQAGQVRLAVYDASGRMVRTLLDTHIEAGQHSVSWDASDQSGRTVSAGVYFYTLDAPGFTETRKMILLK